MVLGVDIIGVFDSWILVKLIDKVDVIRMLLSFFGCIYCVIMVIVLVMASGVLCRYFLIEVVFCEISE